MYIPTPINRRGRMLIDNILHSAKSVPMYASYKFFKDELSYSDAGAIAIKVTKNGCPVNMFLFYPDEDGSGNLGSVAIYGAALSGHKAAIESSKLIFGLPIASVKWDEGIEQFLDVTLRPF